MWTHSVTLPGNPFRTVTLDPSWQTPTGRGLQTLAQTITPTASSTTMPGLADELERVGCSNQDIYGPLPAALGPHVRGCWVLDLVLGKE